MSVNSFLITKLKLLISQENEFLFLKFVDVRKKTEFSKIQFTKFEFEVSI